VSTTEAPTEPAGYSLVLPPGWRQVPLDAHATDAVRELVDRAFADVPADVPPDTLAGMRRRMQGQLQRALTSAREGGGTALYLPTERMGDLAVPASFVAGEVRLDGEAAQVAEDGADPAEVPVRVLARLVAADDAARAVEVDGAPAVRTERTAAADREQQLGVDAGSRRIDYLIAVPGRPGRWLTMSCSVLEVTDAPEISELLVELFDAVMTTFRWDAA
jgi:hypothetical protein